MHIRDVTKPVTPRTNAAVATLSSDAAGGTDQIGLPHSGHCPSTRTPDRLYPHFQHVGWVGDGGIFAGLHWWQAYWGWRSFVLDPPVAFIRRA